jgi:thiol-disulfide isomerase/thioredoxin
LRDVNGGDNEEPTAPFAEAADLIASRHANSPDINNFCEILGFLAGTPSWTGSYERHLRMILKANLIRHVQCAAQVALASVVETSGGSRQPKVEGLYKEFLGKFDGQFNYHYQSVEQSLREQAEKRLEGLRLCGIGKPAPEVIGEDLDGRPMKLLEYRDKVVPLSFWATWCSPCMKMITRERALSAQKMTILPDNSPAWPNDPRTS